MKTTPEDIKRIEGLMALLKSDNDSDKKKAEEEIQDLTPEALVFLYHRILEDENCGFGRLKRRAFARWFLEPRVWPKIVFGPGLDPETDEELISIMIHAGGTGKMMREFSKLKPHKELLEYLDSSLRRGTMAREKGTLTKIFEACVDLFK